MATKDLALVGFTLLSQMAVGAFWVVWLTQFLARQQASEIEVRKLSNAALLGIGPVMAVGLLVSFLHLGSPGHFVYNPREFAQTHHVLSR